MVKPLQLGEKLAVPIGEQRKQRVEMRVTEQTLEDRMAVRMPPRHEDEDR